MVAVEKEVRTPPERIQDSNEREQIWKSYRRPGDIHNSKCKDCCCCIVGFVIFVAAIVVLAWGAKYGRPWALLNSWDETGNYCGRKNEDMKDLIDNLDEHPDFVLRDQSKAPYLFIAAGRLDPFDRPGRTQACVEKCPDGDYSLIDALLGDNCSDEVRICPYGVESTEKHKGGLCLCPYKTRLLDTWCVPDVDWSQLVSIEDLRGNLSLVIEGIEGMINAIPGFGTNVMKVKEYWKEILVASLCSIIICGIWIVMLRCAAPCMVYGLAIGGPILLAFLGFWFWQWGEEAFEFGFSKVPDSLRTEPEEGMKINQYFAIACWVLAGIILLLVIFLWSRLKAGVAVVKLASRALFANIGSLLAPLLGIFVMLAFWVFILAAAVLVYSCHRFEIRTESSLPFTDNTTMLRFSEQDADVRYLLIFLLIFTIYISVHIYFQSYYAQSAAVVDWYFSPKDDNNTWCGFECFYGWYLAWTKGQGTITISSLVMTPVYLLIAFCEYVDYKQKQAEAQGTSAPCFARFIVKCAKCCLWCFEKLLRYLNKTIFTVSQIYNRSWWASFKVAKDLLFADVILTAIVNGIITFVLFISKFVVAILTALIFMVYLRYGTTNESHWVVPVASVFVLSFVVAALVLNLFENMLDIVFFAYQADIDLTRGENMYCDGTTSACIDDMKTAADEAKMDGAGQKAAVGDQGGNGLLRDD